MDGIRFPAAGRIGLPTIMALSALAGCAVAPQAPSQPLVAARALQIDPEAARGLISTYRGERGLAPVRLDPTLRTLAQDQADAMAKADHLSHEVQGPLSTRLARARLAQATAVENVSAGYATTQAVFVGWCRSPAHNANLLDPAMRRMGIAAAEAPGTRYKFYWALVMTD
ncbi:CAP domain-containing protein [Beijerinckia indica]|uniref:SCP-like extracellular n=1 Tax=Beijerinckia indica subsp. indica (strain ATCC 9039 / DSM 1715 / NCIMB 8712) TaxID=395963 RepID=B2ID16_BEII9|nr:CAP domain-containing protein [Beijerinckia indica]ACB96781.1 SCP-like extracellular [Beijerinckia indica subsp. indica ATCC 9039]